MCYNTPMTMATSPTVRISFVVTLLLSLVACTEAPPSVDPEYAAEIEEWRNARLERLTADDATSGS